MAYAYAVEHMWGRALNISLFKDRTQAENYASKYNGILVELWPANNNNPSTPSSTTSEEDFLPRVQIVTPAHTH